MGQVVRPFPTAAKYQTIIVNTVTQIQEPILDIEPSDTSLSIVAFDNAGQTTIQLGTNFTTQFPSNVGTNNPSMGLLGQASDGAHVHPFRLVTVAKSVNYQMTLTDCVVRATGGAGGITITMPALALGIIGAVYIVMKIDSGAGAVTVAPAGANTILGGNPSLASQGSSVTLRGATATSWERIATI